PTGRGRPGPGRRPPCRRASTGRGRTGRGTGGTGAVTRRNAAFGGGRTKPGRAVAVVRRHGPAGLGGVTGGATGAGGRCSASRPRTVPPSPVSTGSPWALRPPGR